MTAPKESYTLPEDQPGWLLVDDCRLCQRFAREGIVEFFKEWEGEMIKPWIESTNRPYPRWMKEPGFLNIEWGRQKEPKKRKSGRRKMPLGKRQRSADAREL
jgi:hypothetical protein